MLPLARAVIRTAYREARTLSSIQGNNFFWFAVLLSLQPESMGFIWTLIGLLMMGPALAAPLARIPAIRLHLWPLAPWNVKVLWPFTRPDTHPSPLLWRVLPLLELRQIVRTLDFWLALVLAVASTLYRFLYSKAQPEAFPVLAMMIVLALSTLAQNLFSLDGVGGRLRWGLSPVRGYRLLLRKGAILIAVTAVLTIGLEPVGAMAGMMAALAVGHHFSVLSPVDSPPWRFTMGQFFPFGFIQVIAMFSCGIASARGDNTFLIVAGAAWLLSGLAYGWVLEQAGLGNV